ncbi:MAG: TRAP transporter large permease subunit [Deltaproteobacteria bacterium]|nr:TRAP transporter large permease subunit [Deltaproteobacteria bacterium]MBW1795728.1 TRAP transporter large permease subunit [Deltaproteobacteria bacterium]
MLRRLAWWAGRTEDAILAIALLLMALIPVVELVGRTWFSTGIPGATEYLQHLTLWIGFLGAMLATREGKHLRIAVAMSWLPPGVSRVVDCLGGFISAAVCTGLFGASLQLVVAEAPGLPSWTAKIIPDFVERWLDPFGLFESGSLTTVGGWIPIWVAEAVMPFGFAVMAIRFILHASKRGSVRALVGLSLPAMILLPILFSDSASQLVLPGLILLIVAALLGTPLFILLGGAALLLFWGDGVTVAAIPAETYRIVASPIFPTIPLLTLAGFILSEGHTSERLVRVFRALFGWIPGGLAVAATLLCAFFTTFTGASGVTILALGGLLLPVLLKSGFRENFSVGLLTSTGSLGLLLPPSLVVILYGVIAHVPIIDMFKAGLVPGILLIAPICLACIWQGFKTGAGRAPFRLREAGAAIWIAKWEVIMPILVLVLIFGGFCTLVEASAVLVVYALIVEAFIYRDLGLRVLVTMLVKCAALVGGVLIILGVAMGLTSYLVDAQVPMHAATWAAKHVHTRWLFLLALNGGLIIVGCLMDIYSALVVVVPLILPVAESFGVHPAHLGIIFLANLQLGYLTPPVGMNLFFASFRFERPLTGVSRDALPFLLIMAVVVLFITYVPWLTVGVLELLK